jgi:hypothetical protein
MSDEIDLRVEALPDCRVRLSIRGDDTSRRSNFPQLEALMLRPNIESSKRFIQTIW